MANLWVLTLRLRSRDGDDIVAEFYAGAGIAARGDDNELPPTGDVGDRRRVAADRQTVFPELCASLNVKSAKSSRRSLRR